MNGYDVFVLIAWIAFGWTLVLLNALFVAASYGLSRLRGTQLSFRDADDPERVQRIKRVLAKFDASLGACQLGIVLTSLALGWIGAPLALEYLVPILRAAGVEGEYLQKSVAFVLGFVIVVIVYLIPGELLPRMIAIRFPLRTSQWVFRPLGVMRRLLVPVYRWLYAISTLLLKQFGIDSPDEKAGRDSEEALRLILSLAHLDRNQVDFDRQSLLHAMVLRQRLVREVMQPRTAIVFLDFSRSLQENLEKAFEEEYSRYPLCEDGDLDQAVGLVHFRDLCRLDPETVPKSRLKEVMKELIFVSETSRLERVLEQFLKRKTHFGLVVDEYGEIVGMVTLENVLEVIVGQIQDEFDQEDPQVKKLDTNRWELRGNTSLRDLSEIVGSPMAQEGTSTVSGWLTLKLGGFPKVGDQVDFDDYRMTVLELDGLKVQKLHLTRRTSAAPRDESQPAG